MENEQALVDEAPRTVTAVHNLKVTGRVSYEAMASYRGLLKNAIKFFEDRDKPRIAEAWKHHHNLVADLNKDLLPLQTALKYANEQLSSWDTEQKRLAEIAQRQLNALQKEDDEDKRLQLAALAEKAGEPELADQILNTPSPEPTIVVQADVPNVWGLSYRDDWHFDVIDANLIPRDYLKIDESKIGKIVRALKRTTNIPGIRVYSIKVPIGRR